MTRGGRTRLAAIGLWLTGCVGPGAAVPQAGRLDLARAYAEAFRLDAVGDAGAAVRAHLDVVRAAARANGDAWQVPALEASLDALATRTMVSLGDASADAGLAWRTGDGPAIAADLARVQAQGTFARGMVARARVAIAQRRGNAQEAEAQRAASGCVREALVVGPTSWAPVTGVEEPGPLDAADAPIEAAYARGDAFGTQAHPVVVRGRGCAIDLSAESVRPGVREVVVDVEVPHAQKVGIVLRAHGAAVLRAGGTPIAHRPFDLGDGPAARFARVTATAGALRLVARVGTAKDDDSVELDVYGEDGAPLVTRAPVVGSRAGGRVLGVAAIEPALDGGVPAGATEPVAGEKAARPGTEAILLLAASRLAAGDPREAERILWGRGNAPGAPAELALLYGRAVETARDLSLATRAERARSAYERVLEVWPTSWEAAIAHAVLAGVRRGREEAGAEVLRDLDSLRAKMGAAKPPPLDAFEALTSGRDRLFDRARAAFERARGPLAGAALLADAENAATPRAGTELVAAACDPARTRAQDTLACFDALRLVGDRGRSAQELARLRALLGSPERFHAIELREALVAGDDAAASRIFGAMLPAERTLAALGALDRSAPLEARTHLLRAASEARDAPGALPPLLRAAGDDPTADLQAIAERLAAQDRSAPILATAATAVLAHTERYEVDGSGLLRWRLFDVRRVSGTTDVEENAQASAPDVWGRAAARSLRRRILKRDGRVLDPEPTPHASQGHADLSQLEQGDIVEAIYEGWSLPGDTGDLGIDTPDLLPERTSVHDATIELVLPRTLRGALWSHPLLGTATQRDEGGSRVLTWHVADQAARRVEDGVPQMDRSARVSFASADWATAARALRETVATLQERDPEIAAWAHEAAATSATGAGPSGAIAPREEGRRAIVDDVVVAAGKALHEGDAGALSDYAGGIASVQQQTARSFLTSHDGSRSWLVLRALRELGVACDLVVAEVTPFSADPAFPAHFGRFVHPLVVAHVDGKDVWIDADVQGPPLPAGRISPELRGRLALRADGTIEPLPTTGTAGGERDEVDIRLALDGRGDARGSFTIVLRGRDAQALAEALVKTVGAERQRALRDVVLAWLPWANVDDVQLSSTEGSWQISLRAEVTVNGYAQLENAKTWLLPGLDTLHTSSPRARVSGLVATFATRAGRENALALSRAVQYHVHRRIDLPQGARVSRMPGPLDVKAKLVEASRRIGVATDSTGIEDDFVLGVATGTVPPKDYDAFVSVARATDDGFLASTKVTLP
jgi:hypothetical protein